jgi:hypothetical protein
VQSSLAVVNCVDILAYLELFHLCEAVGDTLQDFLVGRLSEELCLLRKRDRMNLLALLANTGVCKR